MSDQPSILFSDPDMSLVELEAVEEVLKSPGLSGGPVVEDFEAAFAEYLGRQHAVAVSSATMGLLLALRAYGIGPGDEVIASPFGFRETAHAITLAGAKPVFVDIDYWTCTIVPDKAAAAVTPQTRAIVACNVNGHPALWAPLRALADERNLILIEDSSEAIGSRYQGKLVGNFGDCSIFDFTQPSALTTGEGGMVVTDDRNLAARLRGYRNRRRDERKSVVLGDLPPYRAEMSDINAALGLAQLERLDGILERRKDIEAYYDAFMQSFEGIKPAYQAPEVDELHWMVYLVHLGTRFTRSSRDVVIQDLATAEVEAVAFCAPLHTQRHYVDLGYRKGQFFVTEKLADRAIALPFHCHLTEDQIGFIVQTAKDSSINVGAGAAIYL
ncbi:DegT/DnrJ/EryC1/StrS family aminotransferase [Methylococcus geothermalis]|uniref:Aminotransferase class I/II-fold pyridoxal phosphate-dependent enzyme n=1 Tax=Methylococcus geothermalis TaxID=2681310 RepID=A0A858Q6N4_9GAMM|nr:DegT/DnrJ/EryC1/StrS family aminotransferase [Methylococcus geothermalis]QJD29376.1 aminotransferase class I/II-fold pyridoxal phosphate-dependent enzyme [Methylococcus geothermalis]